MSRKCDLTGKSAQTGHKVSHSNHKTKRRFLPNLVNVTLTSDTLNRSVRFRISANALKTVDHRGGLDAFLAKAKDVELSPKALDLKRQLAKKKLCRSQLTSFFGLIWSIACESGRLFYARLQFLETDAPSRSSSVNCSRIVRWIIEKLSSETSVSTVSPLGVR